MCKTEESHKTLVSIIIPVYNSEAKIVNAIQSLQEQTLNELEIIVVDDCSKDNTFQVVQSLALRDDRIRVFRQEKNQGPGTARNKGIEMARGEYLAFVDADDWVEKNYYQIAYNVLKNTSADVIVSGYSQDTVDKNGQLKICKKVEIEEALWTEDMGFAVSKMDFCKLFSYIFNKLYKREIVLNNQVYFSTKRFNEDFDFNVKYFQYVHSVKTLKEVFYHYIKSEDETLTNRHIPDFYDIICERYLKIEEYLALRAKDKNTAEALAATVHVKHLIASFVRNCEKKAHMNVWSRNKKIKEALCSYDGKELKQKVEKGNVGLTVYVRAYCTGFAWLIQFLVRGIYIFQKYFQTLFEKFK